MNALLKVRCWRKGFWLMLAVLALGLSAQAQFVPPNSPSYTYQWHAPGEGCEYMFIGTMRLILPMPKPATNMLLDRHGDLIWYQQAGEFVLDFKVHANGLLSYSSGRKWYILDSTFSLMDSVACVDAPTDDHDLIMTADGHYFLICRKDSVMDLSSIRTRNGTPGSTQAQVRMLAIQELDTNQQLVREWNGFDHYSVFDSDTMFFTNPGLLDHTHTNSLDYNADGQLLVSSRHLNELTAIDWATGAIRWRLSGKNNVFDLQGDPGFYGQHDARWLPQGRVSVFDNGNDHHPGRGLVMRIDTAAWTATVEKQFSDGSYSNSMGSFRLQPDGKGLVNLGEIIGFGSSVQYYAADSTKLFSITFPSSYATYRAQCFALPFGLQRPSLTCTQQSGQFELGVQGTHSAYVWTNGETTPTVTVTDTGWYQVYVPYGVGMIASLPVHITDLQNPCSAVAAAPSTAAVPREPKCIGRYDLLGHPVVQPQPWQLILERYDDGSSRKVVWVRE